jgi:hypothetical protein
MVVFSAIFFLVIAAVAIYPTVALQKCQHTTWWDYVYPFTGVVAWFLLLGVGSTATLSNFVVEVFCMAVLSALLPWGRWLLSGSEKDQIKMLSFLLTFLPILAAVVMRLTMPELPE